MPSQDEILLTFSWTWSFKNEGHKTDKVKMTSNCYAMYGCDIWVLKIVSLLKMRSFYVSLSKNRLKFDRLAIIYSSSRISTSMVMEGGGMPIQSNLSW